MRSSTRHFQPDHQVIHIQPLAQRKPAMGAPCNGCGLCCLAEPCPLGVLLSRSRIGPCKALQWDGLAHQYRCGALGPAQAPQAWSRLKAWVVRRWIAAGVGCDCDLEPAPSATMDVPPSSTHATPHD